MEILVVIKLIITDLRVAIGIIRTGTITTRVFRAKKIHTVMWKIWLVIVILVAVVIDPKIINKYRVIMNMIYLNWLTIARHYTVVKRGLGREIPGKWR